MRAWTIRLDHVAIATTEPEKLGAVLEVLGLEDRGSEAVPSQGVEARFVAQPRSTGQAAMIEILEPTDPSGVIAKFLKKRGSGVHHMSFAVSDLEKASKALRAAGMRLVYDSPRPGAHGAAVNFVHPESTGGVLIEISEKTS